MLTDLVFPMGSEVEVVHAVKSDARISHLPVVAVTAPVWDPIAEEAREAGAIRRGDRVDFARTDLYVARSPERTSPGGEEDVQ